MKLFNRQPRGVEPTAAGLRLAEHGRLADLQLRDALRAIGSLDDEPAGTVVVGAGPAWLRRLLPEAVSRAIARHPRLNVRIVGGFDDALLRDLRSGEIDLVVAKLPEPRTAADLVATPLVQDDLGIAAREGHPLASCRRKLADLLDHPWIMPPANTRARRRLEALFVAAGLPAPEVRIETASMAFLLQALRGGDLLTLTVSTTLLAADGGGLAWLDVPEVRANREAGILMRRGGWASPAMRAVIDELTALCAGVSRRVLLAGAGALTLAAPFRSVHAQGRVAPITIVINRSPWFESFRKTVELYEKESGNKVELDVNPFAGSPEKQRNSVRAARGQYDILIMNSGWFIEMYAGGFFEALSDIEAGMKLDPEVYSLGDTVYWDPARKNMTPAGKFMSAPISPLIPLLYYRSDLYKQAGLSAPKTVAELEANSRRFHKPPGIYGIIQRGARGPHTVAYDFYPYL